MKRLLIVLVVSLVLGLVGGVGSAWATLVPPPNETGSPLQSATQSNDATNTADQTATSSPTVISDPNVAVLNGGDVNQNSGNSVDASATNNATQVNDQSNGAGQSQTVRQDGGSCCSQSSGSAEQTVDQSNDGTNEANQTATSTPLVISGPNVAVLNGGDVDQNSGNKVDASTENNASQTNNQSNGAGQSQTVGHGDNGCCTKSSSSGTQSANQSNEGSNEANQSAYSAPVVISGGNYAILNKGDVEQNSGNHVDASSTNNAYQANNQSNGAGQSQTVGRGGSGCCSESSGSGTQSANQSNWGQNEANQTATSRPTVISGPNVAIGNGWGHDSCNPCNGGGGTVHQNSGNKVDASATNNAYQVNKQSNLLGQSQWVKDSGGWSCCSKDGGATQTADQSNWGKNEANQTATSAPLVISGGNYAILNKGGVHQNSGNKVDASAMNNATQVNNQSNGLGQSQRVKGGGHCCPPKDDCRPQCEPKRDNPKRCEPNRCHPECEESLGTPRKAFAGFLS
jgi:hypothetical protein